VGNLTVVFLALAALLSGAGADQPALGQDSGTKPAYTFTADQTRAIEDALKDQRRQLLATMAALDTWDAGTRISFQNWFGTTDPNAVEIVRSRVRNALDMNARLTPSNFVPAPSDVSPDGKKYTAAYVKPYNPQMKDTIFLPVEFFSRLKGELRPGVLTHEFTHFDAQPFDNKGSLMGTDDVKGKDGKTAYGPARALALETLAKLRNADNLRLFSEDIGGFAPKQTPPPKQQPPGPTQPPDPFPGKAYNSPLDKPGKAGRPADPDFGEEAATVEKLDKKIRSLKDDIVAQLMKGEKPDEALLKALALLEAERAQQLERMTLAQTLAELDRVLSQPDAKVNPDLLNRLRNLRNNLKSKPLPVSPTVPGILPRKDPADVKVPTPSGSPPAALPPPPAPPGSPSPKLTIDEKAPRTNPAPVLKKPPQPEVPPDQKKEKKTEGPFTVYYYRKGDYPKGGELYGIFKTRAAAMQAVAAIRRWAATINDPTWSIEVIEVIDDSTGKSQILRLQANGSIASPPNTGNGAGATPGNFGPGWVNATPRPRTHPPLKPPVRQAPKQPGSKQGETTVSGKHPGTHPNHPPDKNKPGRGGKTIVYNDKQKKDLVKQQQPAAGNKNTNSARGKVGQGEKKPSGIGTAGTKPKPTGNPNPGKPSGKLSASGKDPNTGKLTSKPPAGNKQQKPGGGTSGGTAGKPPRPGGSPTLTGGRPSTQGHPSGKQHKPGSSVTSPPHKPQPHPQTGPSGTPHRPSPHAPSYSSPPPHYHSGGPPPRSQNDGRAQARAGLLPQLRDVNARIRQHNSYKPSPYNHAAVDAYNAEARALNSEKARIVSQLR
jgi:hypothetical protein